MQCSHDHWECEDELHHLNTSPMHWKLHLLDCCCSHDANGHCRCTHSQSTQHAARSYLKSSTPAQLLLSTLCQLPYALMPSGLLCLPELVTTVTFSQQVLVKTVKQMKQGLLGRAMLAVPDKLWTTFLTLLTQSQFLEQVVMTGRQMAQGPVSRTAQAGRSSCSTHWLLLRCWPRRQSPGTPLSSCSSCR